MVGRVCGSLRPRNGMSVKIVVGGAGRSMQGKNCSSTGPSEGKTPRVGEMFGCLFIFGLYYDALAAHLSRDSTGAQHSSFGLDKAAGANWVL